MVGLYGFKDAKRIRTRQAVRKIQDDENSDEAGDEEYSSARLDACPPANAGGGGACNSHTHLLKPGLIRGTALRLGHF